MQVTGRAALPMGLAVGATGMQVTFAAVSSLQHFVRSSRES